MNLSFAKAERNESSAPLAEVRTYDDLLIALRARANRLELAGETIDNLSGLPERYSAKILSAFSHKRGKQVRRIGMLSLGPILGALGLKLIVAEDPEALRHVQSRA